MRLGTSLAAAAVVALPFMVSPAFAMGGGGSDSNQTAQQCKNGKVWDNNKQKCVDPKKSELDEDTIYQGGRALAMAGRYGEAIEVLSTIADSGDPRVFNYLGYSHRHMGRVLVGLGYYNEALTADPNFTLAREYMGEAYLQINDVASAKAQLGEIASRRGTGCEEYRVLKAQIDDYLKKA